VRCLLRVYELSTDEKVRFSLLDCPMFCSNDPPTLAHVRNDAALNAKWWTLMEIQQNDETEKQVSKGVVEVIQQEEELYQKDVLL
jgi:hypothetical protein